MKTAYKFNEIEEKCKMTYFNSDSIWCNDKQSNFQKVLLIKIKTESINFTYRYLSQFFYISPYSKYFMFLGYFLFSRRFSLIFIVSNWFEIKMRISEKRVVVCYRYYQMYIYTCLRNMTHILNIKLLCMYTNWST